SPSDCAFTALALYTITSPNESSKTVSSRSSGASQPYPSRERGGASGAAPQTATAAVSRDTAHPLERQLLEAAAALLVVVEHVVARAGRRQQHGIARLRERARARDRLLERPGHVLDFDTPAQVRRHER